MAADLDRRSFLRNGALAGLALAAADPAAGAEPPKVRRYPTLGRTGLRVCDIGFGSSRLRSDGEDVVRHALERGINYFDTAGSYTGGESERTLGHALEGRRDEVVLISKTKIEAGMRRDEMMRRLEESLRRLRTDHVDVYFNHAVNDLARVTNPEWPEFSARAREQGKIRFTGLSGHGGNLTDCIREALRRDLVDVLLVGFNFGQDPAFYRRFVKDFDFVALQPDLLETLAEAKRKGVGVVAMKTLRGARKHDLRPYEVGDATFAQAAFRWTLSHRDVDSLVVTMRAPSEVDEYLGASGWTETARGDARLLRRYEALNGASQCRYGCGDCAGACPAGVEIPEVLRARMYAEDYGDLDLARADYARIGADASPCTACSGQPCLAACPHGVAIPELTKRAARLLG